MKSKSKKLYKIISIETGFWLVSFVVLLFVFRFGTEFSTIDFVYTGLFHISLVTVVWVNNCFLIPFFLNKGRYITYLATVPFLVFLGAWFNDVVFSHLSIFLAPGFFFITYHTLEERLLFHLGYIITGSVPFLLSSWYEKEQLKRDIIELKRLNSEKELENLTNQIHPHFFFNALNTIYSLSLNKSDKTPDAIIDLSETMRYAVDKGSKDLVPLQEELDGVQAYIRFQNLRLENKTKPELVINNPELAGLFEIPPFIILTLVENIFNHADLSQKAVISVDIDMEKLKIQTQNTTLDKPKSERKGYGLENMQRRLSLTFPDQYNFSVDENDGRFITHLTLQKKSDKH